MAQKMAQQTAAAVGRAMLGAALAARAGAGAGAGLGAGAGAGCRLRAPCSSTSRRRRRRGRPHQRWGQRGKAERRNRTALSGRPAAGGDNASSWAAASLVATMADEGKRAGLCRAMRLPRISVEEVWCNFRGAPELEVPRCDPSPLEYLAGASSSFCCRLGGWRTAQKSARVALTEAFKQNGEAERSDL